MFRTAFVLTGERAAAEDLVQETLARVLLVWRRVAANGEPDAYTYRVMVNTHRRSGWKVLTWERPTARLPDRPGPDEFARTESLDQLSRILTRLPARQRCAVVLRHYLQFSEAETATVLGCRIGTVKSLTSRGLAQLRVAIDDQRPDRRPPAAESPSESDPPTDPTHLDSTRQRNDSHG
ncbi:hypothetical protein BCD49_17700 [Pseudofrankia sp. EUN1h]|nr:hypothetical protein BCD49_17700 [Pseudofrankia sp. EUN1h]